MPGPHDRLFRYLFNHPARATALLRHNLPASLVAEVDWSSLRRESGTLVEGERETRNDLLFSARRLHGGEDAPPHYFLIEHQSTVERSMALRLHDYAWRLILHWREQHPASRWIPEVTALVVYARQGRSWSAPLRLEEHYRLPRSAASEEERLRWAVRFEYRVDDLSTQSEQAVREREGPPLVALGLLVLRLAGSEHLARRLPEWSELFAQVHASPNGPLALYRIIRYLHQLGDEPAHAALRRVLASFMKPERAEALMRTMEEVLKERGREEGLAKGRAEGLAEGEARGLAKGEAKGLARAVLQLLTARGVRVDEASRRRIQRCRDVGTLERWLERAVSATRISQVLDDPA
jgi:flagellar biosynthesis/type III secretory pathway protein FliH